MKFYKEGDKSRAICSFCEGLVHTTFLRRDVPFDDGVGSASGVLVSVCDTCDRTVGVPAQSTPAIKAAREAAVVSIETRLPASYLDRLDHAMNVITAAATTKHRKMFISLYIDYLAREFRDGNDLVFGWCKHPNYEVFSPVQTKMACLFVEKYTMDVKHEQIKRLSLKLNAYIAEELETLQQRTQLNRTEFMKHMIRQMQEDVVIQPKQNLMAELTLLARAAM